MEHIILLWNKDIGFVRVAEGNGSNLTAEDEDEGYKDYVMVDFIEFDGYDFKETDGAQVMLTKLYNEMFEDANEAVEYLKETGYIPDVGYYFLYDV